jgi:hypothetical protein
MYIAMPKKKMNSYLLFLYFIPAHEFNIKMVLVSESVDNVTTVSHIELLQNPYKKFNFN